MDPIEMVRGAKRVFLCGNGGSAANAVHICNDLISVGIRAHALTADVATLTAIANDFGYEKIFSRQLAVLADTGDVLIALSGSGVSPNIVTALRLARRMGMKTILVTGAYHEHSAGEADETIRVGYGMQGAEEFQITFGHNLMRAFKKETK